MAWLLDTNILSSGAQGAADSPIVRWVFEHRLECFTSSIVFAEIQDGILRLSRHRRERYLHWFADLRHSMEGRILSFSVVTAQAWALLRQRLRKLGKEMSLADSLIAATALEHDLTIVTTDSGFEDRGLKVYNPLAEDGT